MAYTFKVMKGEKIIAEATTFAEAQAEADRSGAHVLIPVAKRNPAKKRKRNPYPHQKQPVYKAGGPEAALSAAQVGLRVLEKHRAEAKTDKQRETYAKSIAKTQRDIANLQQELSGKQRNPLDTTFAAGELISDIAKVITAQHPLWIYDPEDGTFAFGEPDTEYRELPKFEIFAEKNGSVSVYDHMYGGHITLKPMKNWSDQPKRLKEFEQWFHGTGRLSAQRNPSVYQLQPESKQAICKKVASLQVGDFVTMLQKGAAYSPDKVRAEYQVVMRHGDDGFSLEHPTKVDARRRPLTAFLHCIGGDPMVRFGNGAVAPLIGLDVMHLNPSAEELGQIAGKGAHAVGRGLLAGAKALGRFAKSAHAGYTKAQAERKKAQAESKLGVSDEELQEFMRQKEAEFKAKRAQRQALVNPAKPKKVKLIGK